MRAGSWTRLRDRCQRWRSQPASAEDADDARAQREGLPDLARLHPLVATHRTEPHHGEDGHGQPLRPLAVDLGGGCGLALPRVIAEMRRLGAGELVSCNGHC